MQHMGVCLYLVIFNMKYVNLFVSVSNSVNLKIFTLKNYNYIHWLNNF